MACNRITAAIPRQFLDERPIKALLDPCDTAGPRSHVRFNTYARTNRTRAAHARRTRPTVSAQQRTGRRFAAWRNRIFKVIAYTNNHHLGLIGSIGEAVV
jgi:type III restriction enzyme